MYGEWIAPCPSGDRQRAHCKVCGKSFFLSSMGISAVQSHDGGTLHGKKILAKRKDPDQPAISLFKKSRSAKPKNSTSGATNISPACPTSNSNCDSTSTQPTVSSFMVKQGATQAEIIWALKICQSHASFSFCADVKELFSIVPDPEESADSFFSRTVSDSSLLGLIRRCLVLSHGQSEVERGFSQNREVSRDNLGKASLIAQRLVCDHLNKVGGITNVAMSDKLMKSAGMAHTRYVEANKANKEAALQTTRQQKRKACEAELTSIKDEIKRTKFSIEGLESQATALTFSLSEENRPTKAEDILLVVEKSNGLRQQALKKRAQLPELELALASKEAELASV